MSGARMRTDVVEVYVFRRAPAGAHHASSPERVEFLQLRRTREPMRGTWQPVMGHVEAGETSARAAARELLEEAGLPIDDPRVVGFWALERAHPFYLMERDEVVLSTRFIVETAHTWEPVLDASHDAHRWVMHAEDFHWADQHDAVREALQRLVPIDAPMRLARGITPRRLD